MTRYTYGAPEPRMDVGPEAVVTITCLDCRAVRVFVPYPDMPIKIRPLGGLGTDRLRLLIPAAYQPNCDHGLTDKISVKIEAPRRVIAYPKVLLMDLGRGEWCTKPDRNGDHSMMRTEVEAEVSASG